MKPNATTKLENPLCECANCGLRNKANDLDPTHDIWSRIQPGEVLPHGDCPECGAFCYPVTESEKRLTIHEAMEGLLKCAELNQDSLEPETIEAINEGFRALAESLAIKVFTLTSDTDCGMETELFDSEEAQLARMNELMAEDAEEQGIKLGTPGSEQWLEQWDKWREGEMLSNNYYSWDEQTVTLSSRAQLLPEDRQPERISQLFTAAEQ